MRHVDAGYEEAIACAAERGVDVISGVETEREMCQRTCASDARD